MFLILRKPKGVVYPMPDEQVSTPDMQEYGYTYDGMLPVTRERALELDAAGLTVYMKKC